ncbi:MAG: hypothetical protein ABRQ38_31010 [Candidatus Eremiobacterota bacterium]
MKKLDLELCKKLREKGHTYKEIGEYFKVSKQAVFDLLDKAGVKSNKGKYSQYYKEWERLYKEGIGVHKIAEKYGCSRGAVHNYLTKKFIIERGQLMKKRGTQKPAPEVIPTEGKE